MTEAPEEASGTKKQTQISGVEPEIDSRQILGNHRCVRIRHGDQVYRLMETRSGKLILQK